MLAHQPFDVGRRVVRVAVAPDRTCTLLVAYPQHLTTGELHALSDAIRLIVAMQEVDGYHVTEP